MALDEPGEVILLVGGEQGAQSPAAQAFGKLRVGKKKRTQVTCADRRSVDDIDIRHDFFDGVFQKVVVGTAQYKRLRILFLKRQQIILEDAFDYGTGSDP